MPAHSPTGARVALLALLITSSHAHAGIRWSRRLVGCEPPNVFYSARHTAGLRPCCPLVENLCPGGDACRPDGTCPTDGVACQPTPVRARPNVILFIADDQAACGYGAAGECRSTQSGTPIPPPATPNLDLLAGHGTLFPIAHNSSAWCFPSLNTILTGRYQRSMMTQRIGDVFVTLPKAMRALGNDPSAMPDPYDAGNRVGGYCTFQGGKFAASVGDPGFDALATVSERSLGRTTCALGSPPLCGSSTQPAYDPPSVFRIGDLFEFVDSLLHRTANPSVYEVQHFFAWYAPRLPHEPLRPPVPVAEYLFGDDARSGLFQLGRWCAGGTCAPVVNAMNESDFGSERDYYGNVWWADDNVREIREFLARESAPHCIGADGRSRWDVATPAACLGGTWATIAPDLAKNTVMIYLSDNGWFLPHSKHQFTENGHRSPLVVYDPRTEAQPFDWSPVGQTAPPARRSDALVHAVDVLPTIVGYALDAPGGAPCPQSTDGTRCDGHDLRPFLTTAPGGPLPAASLRHSLCGHHTQRGTVPTRERYLLTRPGSVGRCVDTGATACTTSAQCGGAACIAGRCVDPATPACGANTDCPAGAACLGGRCRTAPSCMLASDCARILGPGSWACAAPQAQWCRNDPNVACATADDCPVCPAVDGNPVPCGRVCEARTLKLYVHPGHPPQQAPTAEMTDLFLDPDEQNVHSGGGSHTIAADMSPLGGPYGDIVRRLTCCLDDWWPEVAAQGGTLCSAGFSCPADFVCNQ